MCRLVLLVVLAAGCDPRELFDEPRAQRSGVSDMRDEPPAEKRPLVIGWRSDSSKIKAEALFEGGGKVETSEFHGKYHITLSGVPKHSKWKVGAQSGKTDGPYNLIDVEIADKLANRTFKELEQVDPEAELELELADGRTGKTKLPPVDVSYGVAKELKKAENGPVLFGKEPDDPRKQDSMYWPDGLSDKHWFGKAGKLYEIDWVLVVNKLPDEKGRKVCGGYTSGGKPAPDMTVVFKDTEAVIFNRRTGDVVEKKLFGPDKECPMFTMRRSGENETDSSTPYSAIEAWARSRVKR